MVAQEVRDAVLQRQKNALLSFNDKLLAIYNCRRIFGLEETGAGPFLFTVTRF